jgi:hypothetical protein
MKWKEKAHGEAKGKGDLTEGMRKMKLGLSI